MSIKGAVEEAKKQGKKILVNMIGVKDIKGRAKKTRSEFGVDYICVPQDTIFKQLAKTFF